MRKTSLDQKNAKDDGNEWRTRQWWTQAQLRVAGRCRQSEVSAVSIEERAPEMSEHAKYVRNCARGRAKDWSHKSMSLWRSASSNVVIFSHCLSFSRNRASMFMVLMYVL